MQCIKCYFTIVPIKNNIPESIVTLNLDASWNMENVISYYTIMILM